MSTASVASPAEQVEDAVRRLLNAEKEQLVAERRTEPRFPFFHPATLTYRYRQQEPIPVFTRELSSAGIGLLTDVPLERGEVVVTIGTRDDAIKFRTYILWCRACGPWYLSGGQFLGLGQQA